MINKREYIFDVLRIVSMFLVIIVHISNLYMRMYPSINIISYTVADLFNSISRIAVPIFFMVSGALLLNKMYSLNMYKKRVLKFLRILIFWSLIYIIWNELYLKEGTNILISFFLPIRAHLWFLYAIIGIYIILPFIQILVKNINEKLENLFMWLWLIFTGVVYIYRVILSIYGINTTVEYPVPLVQGTYYLGYFITGYIIYKRMLLSRNIEKHKGIVVSIFLISVLITFLSTLILSITKNIYYESLYGYHSLFVIISSISVYCLFVMHKNRVEKNLNIIKPLSKYSLGVYLVHPIYLDLFSNIIIKLPSYIGTPLFLIIIFCLSYTTIWLASRIKYLRELI